MSPLASDTVLEHMLKELYAEFDSEIQRRRFCRFLRNGHSMWDARFATRMVKEGDDQYYSELRNIGYSREKAQETIEQNPLSIEDEEVKKRILDTAFEDFSEESVSEEQRDRFHQLINEGMRISEALRVTFLLTEEHKEKYIYFRDLEGHKDGWIQAGCPEPVAFLEYYDPFLYVPGDRHSVEECERTSRLQTLIAEYTS